MSFRVSVIVILTLYSGPLPSGTSTTAWSGNQSLAPMATKQWDWGASRSRKVERLQMHEGNGCVTEEETVKGLQSRLSSLELNKLAGPVYLYLCEN